MLGPGSQFKESDKKSATFEGGTQVTSFEDDDFQAMHIIMMDIHLQNDKVPRLVDFHLLDNIAVLCDKYDLRRSLGPWTDLWLQDHLETVEIEGFERWLFIATAFRNIKVYTDITRHLILNAALDQDGELVARGPGFTEGVPVSVLGSLILHVLLLSGC